MRWSVVTLSCVRVLVSLRSPRRRPPGGGAPPGADAIRAERRWARHGARDRPKRPAGLTTPPPGYGALSGAPGALSGAPAPRTPPTRGRQTGLAGGQGSGVRGTAGNHGGSSAGHPLPPAGDDAWPRRSARVDAGRIAGARVALGRVPFREPGGRSAEGPAEAPRRSGRGPRATGRGARRHPSGAAAGSHYRLRRGSGAARQPWRRGSRGRRQRRCDRTPGPMPRPGAWTKEQTTT